MIFHYFQLMIFKPKEISDFYIIKFYLISSLSYFLFCIKWHLDSTCTILDLSFDMLIRSFTFPVEFYIIFLLLNSTWLRKLISCCLGPKDFNFCSSLWSFFLSYFIIWKNIFDFYRYIEVMVGFESNIKYYSLWYYRHLALRLF